MNLTPRTVAFSRKATNVFFHILTQCNLSCRHCYINPAQHGRAMLSLGTIDAWLAAFAKPQGRANVIFLGGEPTLHPDLAEAVRMARRHGYGSITVDTNGYLLHDFIHRVTPAEVDFISFSLDGPDPETNDATRGKGVFDACVRGIRDAVALGFRTSVISTVSRANIAALPRMPALLASLGVMRFFIQVIGLRGASSDAGPAAPGAVNAAGLQVTRQAWQRAVPPVAAAAAGLGLTVTYPKVYLDTGELFECAGNVADNVFIFPNGRVYRCPLCEDYPVHSLHMVQNQVAAAPRLNEKDFFRLDIAEGCVMNKLIQPGNIDYLPDGRPAARIACCLLKEEIVPAKR
ncbi:MAG: radical SAM protein [Pseudomonadota bacterium]